MQEWGHILEKDYYFQRPRKKKMEKVTVEGADLIKEIGKKVKEDFNDKKLPLMLAMIDCILEDKKLNIKWEKF